MRGHRTGARAQGAPTGWRQGTGSREGGHDWQGLETAFPEGPGSVDGTSGTGAGTARARDGRPGSLRSLRCWWDRGVLDGTVSLSTFSPGDTWSPVTVRLQVPPATALLLPSRGPRLLPDAGAVPVPPVALTGGEAEAQVGGKTGGLQPRLGDHRY